LLRQQSYLRQPTGSKPGRGGRGGGGAAKPRADEAARALSLGGARRSVRKKTWRPPLLIKIQPGKVRRNPSMKKTMRSRLWPVQVHGARPFFFGISQRVGRGRARGPAAKHRSRYQALAPHPPPFTDYGGRPVEWGFLQRGGDEGDKEVRRSSGRGLFRHQTPEDIQGDGGPEGRGDSTGGRSPPRGNGKIRTVALRLRQSRAPDFEYRPRPSMGLTGLLTGGLMVHRAGSIVLFSGRRCER